MSEKLTKSERLRGEKRIEALFRSGRRGSIGPVRFCFLIGDVESVPRSPLSTVSVLFSVPKKIFRRAHDRNLIKRRMRESYRRAKGVLIEGRLSETAEAEAEVAARRGVHLDIALVCSPEAPKSQPETSGAPARAPKNAPRPRPEVPDFKTIDDAIKRILEQIAARA